MTNNPLYCCMVSSFNDPQCSCPPCSGFISDSTSMSPSVQQHSRQQESQDDLSFKECVLLVNRSVFVFLLWLHPTTADVFLLPVFLFLNSCQKEEAGILRERTFQSSVHTHQHKHDAFKFCGMECDRKQRIVVQRQRSCRCERTRHVCSWKTGNAQRTTSEKPPHAPFWQAVMTVLPKSERSAQASVVMTLSF